MMPSAVHALTRQGIEKAQESWAQSIVEIGAVFLQGKDYRSIAEKRLKNLYDFEYGVLFRPTLAVEHPFRTQYKEVVSYFIRGDVVEDQGFALKSWKAIRFGSQHFLFHGNLAFAMGYYFFTEHLTGNEIKVEYTFSYRRDSSGSIKIVLHHSSLPNYLP